MKKKHPKQKAGGIETGGFHDEASLLAEVDYAADLSPDQRRQLIDESMQIRSKLDTDTLIKLDKYQGEPSAYIDNELHKYTMDRGNAAKEARREADMARDEARRERENAAKFREEARRERENTIRRPSVSHIYTRDYIRDLDWDATRNISSYLTKEKIKRELKEELEEERRRKARERELDKIWKPIIARSQKAKSPVKQQRAKSKSKSKSKVRVKSKSKAKSTKKK